MRQIELEDHETLVLFEFIGRELEDRKARRIAGVFEHPAEFWALNNLYCVLERLLVEPLDPRYAELVAEARGRVMAQCDPEGTFPIEGR